MKLISSKLADVTLVRVETRSNRKMFRVDVGTHQAGFVEKLAGHRTETHPWKAFRGIGHKARFVSVFYEEDGGLEFAVACVLDRGVSPVN